MERAAHWGWPNTYTYTKSLGEQVIAGTPDLRYAIVRPSHRGERAALPVPRAGTRASPPRRRCASRCIKGQRRIPAGEKTILDMIPVDLVAGSLIAITAQALDAPRAPRLPAGLGRLEPVHRRALGGAGRALPPPALPQPRDRQRAPRTSCRAAHRAAAGHPSASFDARSAPLFVEGRAAALQGAIEEREAARGARRASRRCWSEARDAAGRGGGAGRRRSSMLIELFLPFIWENRYVFRCDNTRSLYARMAPQDRGEDPLGPARRSTGGDYFLEVHLPGLEKWVFPGLEEETREAQGRSPRTAICSSCSTPRSTRFRHRVAFRHGGGRARRSASPTARCTATPARVGQLPPAHRA